MEGEDQTTHETNSAVIVDLQTAPWGTNGSLFHGGSRLTGVAERKHQGRRGKYRPFHWPGSTEKRQSVYPSGVPLCCRDLWSPCSGSGTHDRTRRNEMNQVNVLPECVIRLADDPPHGAKQRSPRL